MNTGNNHIVLGAVYEAGIPGLNDQKAYFPSEVAEPLNFSEPNQIGPSYPMENYLMVLEASTKMTA